MISIFFLTIFLFSHLILFLGGNKLGPNLVYLQLFTLIFGVASVISLSLTISKFLILIEDANSQIANLHLEIGVLTETLKSLTIIIADLKQPVLAILVPEVCACPIIPILLCVGGIAIAAIQIGLFFNSSPHYIIYSTTDWYFRIFSYFDGLDKNNMFKIRTTDQYMNLIDFCINLKHNTFLILVHPKSAVAVRSLQEFIADFLSR